MEKRGWEHSRVTVIVKISQLPKPFDIWENEMVCILPPFSNQRYAMCVEDDRNLLRTAVHSRASPQSDAPLERLFAT